jgi:hypothetical protein
LARGHVPVGDAGVTAISSLLAIAVVRRLLIELEIPEDPDEMSPIGCNLSTWVCQPMSEMDGLTPAELLATPVGLERLRKRLVDQLAIFRAAGRG